MPKRIDHERMRSMLRKGLTNQEIAALLECSDRTVSKVRVDMGLSKCANSHKYERKLRTMPMTDGEICRHWCGLADKVSGIRVLAELNCVTDAVIIDILRRNGWDVKRKEIAV